MKENKKKAEDKVEKMDNNQSKNIDMQKDSNKNSNKDTNIDITENTRKNETSDNNKKIEPENNLVEVTENEIDDEKLSKINAEIKENRKKKRNSPKNNKKYLKILINSIVALIGVFYIELLVLGIQKIPIQEYQTDLKAFIIFALIATIFLFERAYKIDRFSMALYGIETASMGSATILILDLIKRENSNLKVYFMYIILLWILYYLIKNCIIAIRKNNDVD